MGAKIEVEVIVKTIVDYKNDSIGTQFKYSF